jgi:hypothetical protein
MKGIRGNTVSTKQAYCKQKPTIASIERLVANWLSPEARLQNMTSGRSSGLFRLLAPSLFVLRKSGLLRAALFFKKLKLTAAGTAPDSHRVPF